MLTVCADVFVVLGIAVVVAVVVLMSLSSSSSFSRLAHSTTFLPYQVRPFTPPRLRTMINIRHLFFRHLASSPRRLPFPHHLSTSHLTYTTTTYTSLSPHFLPPHYLSSHFLLVSPTSNLFHLLSHFPRHLLSPHIPTFFLPSYHHTFFTTPKDDKNRQTAEKLYGNPHTSHTRF